MIADHRERAIFFHCEGASLLGVLAIPKGVGRLGVVIVGGGPQYRAGSHRQFVLLARDLAAQGIVCLRFDHRGMGDSEGVRMGFEHIGADLRAAIDALYREAPEVERVVLWGLCDGASAIAFYAASDPRVAGIALFNPWVRTLGGEAEARIRHYYARRLLAGEFWRKLVTGGVDIRATLRELRASVQRARGTSTPAGKPSEESKPLPDRVAGGLMRFSGPILVVLSGRDMVAAEFRLAASRAGTLASVMTRASNGWVELPDADHTFSTARWGSDAATATLRWLQAHFGEAFPAGEPIFADSEE